ncbi:ABC transporter permease [Cytobacillus sp. Hz8]|uniref:ABC transporter permease n=1 Tax=Cytobacillus sp. Hz8 TaxID=3347168 RepID=UPI0035DB2858
MMGIFASDFIKIRRKGIIFLMILGPVGVIGLEAVNFILRYDYLTKEYEKDLWRGLIDDAQFLAVPTLVIGLTIIISMIANIEHQTNSWKQLLALPISRWKVFTSKFTLAFVLLCTSSILLAVGTVVLGYVLQFGTDIPFSYLIRMCFYPFLAAMPFIALQMWLSIMIQNQAIPLTIGILGTALSLYGSALPDWVPYKWPTLINDWNEPLYSVVAGIFVGAVIYAIGIFNFVKRDVK